MPSLGYRHIRLSIYGTINTTQSWSINISTQPTAATVTNSDLASWLTAIDSAVQTTWWGAVKALNAGQSNLLGIRASYYAAGSTTAAAAADHPFASLIAGTGPALMPTQSACVVSLLTNQSGRHYKGRLYVPVTGVTMTGTFKLSNGNVDTVNTFTAGLMTTLNATAVAGAANQVIVAGAVSSPAAVLSCRTDNEVDIQRRRADKILASYFKTTSV